MNETVRRIGLGYEVISTFLHGLYRHIDITMPRNQDNRQVRVHRAQAAEQLQAVDMGHANIGYDHSAKIRSEVSKSARCISKGDDGEAGQFQRLPVGISQIVVIVYEGDTRQIIHQTTLGR